MVSVFIPKEAPEGERRVAATPDTVKKLTAKGLKVVVQSGAGSGSHVSDQQFKDAGAEIESDRAKGFGNADIVLQINIPTEDQIKQMKEGGSLISFLWAFEHLDLVKQLNERKISMFAMDAIPRTTRAQKDDALSSQASLAGYKAVLVAANHLHKILPMMMTPAGTIKPARFVIIGVGVAGLQAIATAKRLGAIVEATDPRPETKEQAESLGGKFLEVQGVEVKKGEGGYAAEQTEEYKQAQAEMLKKAFANADAIITTALIPYKKAPVTITAEHVKSMRPGSVIIDLAAERGGNCELTEPGKTVVKEGVTIVGDLNWPSTVAVNSSDMYAKNVQNILFDAMDKQGNFKWDYKDEIVDGAMICHAGEVHHPKVRELMGLPPLKKEEPAADKQAEEAKKEQTAGEAKSEAEEKKA
ncbi:MAG: Re/Si-specific NAD(P)(+) transhydrogenase subunit alpha [Planctomycetes bacterium]|nr:Re/Si-specific NAD(P)(+) transhydrogenase subunit alpha [Planctomycetota bacterium]MCB9935076.1 Re/Si-specific NAD(P)(+) transhydrogenase subunit alpha [Planctomycetota bacterium]